jgi:hypothetical protein
LHFNFFLLSLVKFCGITNMGYYGGQGPMVNGVLWMLVVVLALFVTLRFYTRHQILNAVGIDDWLCVTALVRPTPSTSRQQER